MQHFGKTEEYGWFDYLEDMTTNMVDSTKAMGLALTLILISTLILILTLVLTVILTLTLNKAIGDGGLGALKSFSDKALSAITKDKDGP